MAAYIRCLSSWAKRLLHFFHHIRTTGYLLLLIGVGMIANTLCGGSELILSVKARPDYEPLFSILDGLRPDGKRRYWIESLHVQEDNCGLEVDIGQVNTGVEIVMQMSCETCSAGALTSAAEQIQKE